VLLKRVSAGERAAAKRVLKDMDKLWAIVQSKKLGFQLGGTDAPWTHEVQ
jgi:hypothetical protein